MDIFPEILAYTIPAIVVSITAVLMLLVLQKNDDKRRKHELLIKRKQDSFPLKLQAYERLILFLERIAPDALVMRISDEKLSAGQTQAELLKIIKTEFEHNLTQQLFVSNPAWDLIKSARMETVRLINVSAAELKSGDPGINLRKKILEKAMELSGAPAQKALLYLKNEAREFL